MRFSFNFHGSTIELDGLTQSEIVHATLQAFKLLSQELGVDLPSTPKNDLPNTDLFPVAG